jgi:glycosyltransferase involved in cell wall biosynthesis
MTKMAIFIAGSVGVLVQSSVSDFGNGNWLTGAPFLPAPRFPVPYRHMLKVLHLLSSSADEQTRQIHQMLRDGIGADFSCETKTIGLTGDYRNLPVAVFHLRGNRPDLTYAWGTTALAAAVLAGHRRILFSPDRFAGPRALRWIRSLMSRGNVTMICPTFTQQRLAVSRGIDPDRCIVIQPGVDFGRVRRRTDLKMRESFGLSATDYVVIVPGESTLQSGHDQALWSTSILHVLDPSYKLLLWGRGPRFKAVAELGDRLKQPDLVKVAETGERGPIRFEDLLPIADVCLVTATGAVPTLPIATVMAAGVPIISTVTYMVAELLEDRHTALMVPHRSPRAIAQRIMDLRGDPTLAAKLVDTARAEAYEHFSMTRMLDTYRRAFSTNAEIAPIQAAPDGHPGLRGG